MKHVVGYACCLVVLATYSLTQCARTDGTGWRQGSTVYYSINSNISGSEKTQIQNGIQKWNTANQQNNNSDITFLPSDAGHSPAWTIQNGQKPINKGSQTLKNMPRGDGVVASAVTTIGIETKTDSGSPIYDINQPG